MKKRLSSILLLAGLLSFASHLLADPLVLSDAEMQKLKHYFPATEESHLIWKGDPLSIRLPLNQEKRLVFPTHVTVDIKGALSTDQLRILNDDKSVYLTALKPFSTTRIFVTLQGSNKVLLMDLSTDDKATAATTTIDLASRANKAPTNTHASSAVTTTTNPLITDSEESDKGGNLSEGDTYVTLTRFAWQQLFAPKRLLSNPLGITRASMHTEPLLSTLVYGDKVIAHPEVSWVYNNTYITAVELRNKYPHPATINLNRDLCGDWQTATVYPSQYLKPAGNKPGDSTVLFVISKKPFGEAMEVCNGRA